MKLSTRFLPLPVQRHETNEPLNLKLSQFSNKPFYRRLVLGSPSVFFIIILSLVYSILVGYLSMRMNFAYFSKPLFVGAWILFANVFQFIYYKLRLNFKDNDLRRKIACDLHDDLGNTLTCLKTYTHLAALKREHTTYLQMANDTAKDAINSVKNMIWMFDNKKSSIEDLLVQIKKMLCPLALNTAITVEVKNQHQLSLYKLNYPEKRNLFLIIKEVINNSLKYSNATRLRLVILVHNKKPFVLIKDNGKGFDPDNPTEGNGLKNIFFRSKEIGYELVVDAAINKGTNIKLFKK